MMSIKSMFIATATLVALAAPAAAMAQGYGYPGEQGWRDRGGEASFDAHRYSRRHDWFERARYDAWRREAEFRREYRDRRFEHRFSFGETGGDGYRGGDYGHGDGR